MLCSVYIKRLADPDDVWAAPWTTTDINPAKTEIGVYEIREDGLVWARTNDAGDWNWRVAVDMTGTLALKRYGLQDGTMFLTIANGGVVEMPRWSDV